MYFDIRQKIKAMDTQDSEINIFAMTDCHQEARKLCCLFSGILKRAPQMGKNTLICDSGDLFKGIYDRQLCVDSYVKLREALPLAKIVIAVGNNDFGFSYENVEFLQKAADAYNNANIHLLCANLQDINTGKCPKWVEPYILLEINQKKVLVTAFCINQIKLQRYGLKLTDIKQTFSEFSDTVKQIAPDGLIILNHDLLSGSLRLCQIAEEAGIRIDLLVGGHEHAPLIPLENKRIYYPRAFSRNMFYFQMWFENNSTILKLKDTIWCQNEDICDFFVPQVETYETKSGLNQVVAKSVLDLPRSYGHPSALGTFIADLMKSAAKTRMAAISTGYMTHALRYEKDKILTMYNLERAFFSDTTFQKVNFSVAELKSMMNNAVKMRYVNEDSNTYFLQYSQNVKIVCTCSGDKTCIIKQIYINSEPLLDDIGNPLREDEVISCALDPYIAAGGNGFDMLKTLPKETMMRDNQMLKIKDLFVKAIKEAESKYIPGSVYPTFELEDDVS